MSCHPVILQFMIIAAIFFVTDYEVINDVMMNSVLAVVTQLCLTESTFIEAIVAIIVETCKITNMAVYSVQQAHQKWIFKNGAKRNDSF